MHPNHVLTW